MVAHSNLNYSLVASVPNITFIVFLGIFEHFAERGSSIIGHEPKQAPVVPCCIDKTQNGPRIPTSGILNFYLTKHKIAVNWEYTCLFFPLQSSSRTNKALLWATFGQWAPFWAPLFLQFYFIYCNFWFPFIFIHSDSMKNNLSNQFYTQDSLEAIIDNEWIILVNWN